MKVYEGARSLDGGIVIVAGKPLPPRRGELTCRGNSPRNRWFESVSLQRQSPECAYDIVFFDEFARAAGWTERLSLENPEWRPPS